MTTINIQEGNFYRLIQSKDIVYKVLSILKSPIGDTIILKQVYGNGNPCEVHVKRSTFAKTFTWSA